jgi:hypothetical protein
MAALPTLLVASLLLCPSTNAQTSLRTAGTREVMHYEREPAAESTTARTAPAPRGKSGGFVVAAFTGGASTLDSPLIISQPAAGTQLTFRDVRFDGRSFDPPLYYGLRGGYFLRRTPSVGVEAEFIHLKVYSDAEQRVRATGTLRGAPLDTELPLSTIVGRYSISHGVNLLLFNLAARRAFSDEGGTRRPRFILSARAGEGPTIPHTESTIEDRAQEQYEFGRLAVQAAGGAEVRLVGGLYLIGEYKFTRTQQRGRVAEGEAESLLRTHHGVIGLSYHF